MLIIRLWNYFRGYVIIRIEGLTLERFINLATLNDIYLWDIDRFDYTTLEAKVSIKGFKELKKIIIKAGCRFDVISKEGLPFVLNKLKRRKMLVVGFILMIGVIFFLTSFIWNIEIVGSKDFDEGKLIEYLDKEGIKTGIKKSIVNEDELQIDILKKFDDIAYVDIDIQGTNLVVEVKKRSFYTEDDKIDKNKPCNIVANKKAVIEKVIAKNGNAVVEKGEIVEEGQVLITGIVQNDSEENILLVHSEGEVLARTYYYNTIKEPIIKQIQEETGEKYFSRELKIGNKSIHLKNGDIPFKDYLEFIDDKENGFYSVIPFNIVTHEYREVEIKTVKQNVDSLKESLNVIITKEAMEKIPEDSKVLSKEIDFETKDNFLIAKIKIELIEDIGKKEYIQNQIEKYEEE
ncbi:sporulation protein YqfD [Clostridium sp. D2Q-11]|uniref:Sporulation protein YqfD n=1 Tax=Anaeromonas frigoriresistens TaxID=2683708 RepID=A0A942UUA2_9FIRM|nr:sporulation protein YqfD [Anaeromonas frigoriresistens]MBS4536899.1 sporulation protein YqfD [Anaeromonas frigoriresistens]